ncbi:5-hydroxymethyl-dUMP N-hydrolase isoform X1 [Mustelus asterias]
MSLGIYFCGSIRGGRQDVEIYSRIIKHLKKFGTVFTEHIGNPTLNVKGEDEVKGGDKYIHDRDLKWLEEADVIVAEVTQPSLGVGYEIGRAMHMNKKILCLFRTSSNHFKKQEKFPLQYLALLEQKPISWVNSVRDRRSDGATARRAETDTGTRQGGNGTATSKDLVAPRFEYSRANAAGSMPHLHEK